MELVDLGDFFEGQVPEGFYVYLLSPFDGVLTDAEAREAIFDIQNHPSHIQDEIRNDFVSFFDWFGTGFIEFEIGYEDVEDRLDAAPKILMTPKINGANLVPFLDNFLDGAQRTPVFHVGKSAFVRFGFDLSVLIYSKSEIEDTPEMRRLKFVKLN